MSIQHGAITVDQLTPESGSMVGYDAVIVATPDLAGRLVGKRLTTHHFVNTHTSGVRTCDVVFGWGLGHELLDGFQSVGWEQGYGDFISRPDLNTLRPLAWWPRTALVLGDAFHPDGSTVSVSPRAILRQQIEHAQSVGFHPWVVSELEFTLFNETSTTLQEKGYTNLRLLQTELHPELVETIHQSEHVLTAICTYMEGTGIPIESIKAEYSPGQVEINLSPAAPLEMADRHVIYKMGVREICRQHGHAATFMAKWHQNFGGSSCHMHISLQDNDRRNLFAEGNDRHLSTFIGGLQRYARDVFLLWALYPNSYKRFRPGSFAPASLNWGVDNRTATFRVVNEGASRHVENRIPGGDVNPYLGYAALLAAGLAGIEEHIEPYANVGHTNAYAQSELPALPQSLDEAIQAFATSDFAKRAFGTEVVSHLANFAAKELEASRLTVTDWDRLRLFDV